MRARGLRRAIAAGALGAVVFAGFSASPAGAATFVKPFRCDGSATPYGPSVAAMENEYVLGTGYGPCWFHLGHHTYDAGAPYKVHGVTGATFSVEIPFSPPLELNPPYVSLSFEASADGLNWTTVARPNYIAYQSRQTVPFSFDMGGITARYFRIRQPLSSAQGLSGYLDSSWFDATVETTTAPPPPATAPHARSYACASHAMERFWSLHPCWFGGVNRYDSPSVFHTYVLGGPSTVDRVRGSATFGPWRTDDYWFGGGTSTLRAHVLVSANGTAWTKIGTFTGRYGTALPFDFAGLDAKPAQYVRIVAEYHSGGVNPGADPALKHVRGFLLDSSIEVTGALPA